ncbi:MAG: PilZ domain-containing protein, partial [Bradymonadia bacterium]
TTARSDADFDPFADLAAELHALDPDAELGDMDEGGDGGSLEPILGYDFAPIEDTPVPALPVEAPPPHPVTTPAASPVVNPPSIAPPSDSMGDRFRPTRGRVEKSIRPAPRAPDLSRPLPPAPRSAATFAVLADELSSGLHDPWSELDIGDLRMSGHPGPLPRGRAPETVQAERARAQRAPRAGLSAKVGIEYGSTFFTGFSGNVSRGGLFVATPNALPHGARVEVFFEMPDGHAISAPATVCWHRPAEQAALEGLPAGLGFRFVELSHDDEIALERFIGAQEASILYEG